MRRGDSKNTNLGLAALLLSLGASLAGCALIAGLEDPEAIVGAGGQGGSSSPSSSQSTGSGGTGGTGGNPVSVGGGTTSGGGSGGSGGGNLDAYGAAIIADDPIAYFRFDDAVGAASAANEIPNSPITAVYPASDATLGVPGIDAGGTAIRFETEGAKVSVFGGVDFPDDQTFTLEVWVRLDAAGAVRLYDQINNNAPGGRSGSNLFITDADLVRTEAWNSGDHIMYNLTTTSPPVSQFFHIALRHRMGEADELYVNAAAADGQQLDPGDRPMMNKTFEWGGYVGSLDEFAVYDYALNDGQIAAHFVAGGSSGP